MSEVIGVLDHLGEAGMAKDAREVVKELLHASNLENDAYTMGLQLEKDRAVEQAGVLQKKLDQLGVSFSGLKRELQDLIAKTTSTEESAASEVPSICYPTATSYDTM